MQRTVEHIIVVQEMECDRCGLRERRSAEGGDIRRMTSIGFETKEGSIFGPGQRVEIDLCEPCLRSALGGWLRVTEPVEGKVAANLSANLAAFDPQRHGGEFPAGDAEGLDEVVASLAVAEYASGYHTVTPGPSVVSRINDARTASRGSPGWPS